MKNGILQTAFGRITLIDFSEFLRRITIEQLEGSFVRVPIMPVSMSFVQHFTDEIPFDHVKFEQKDIKLKPFYSFIKESYIDNKSIELAQLNFCSNKFKQLLAKKKETFFLKDLNLENINKLSKEHAMNGGGDVYGFHITLSQYQKFFVLAEPEAFRAFFNQGGKWINGEFVDLYPNKWYIGRYENLEYINELSKMRMY